MNQSQDHDNAMAAGAALTARDQWLVDNFDMIEHLERDFEETIMTAWNNECDEPPEEFDLPYCGILDLAAEARDEMARREYQHR